MTGQTVTLDMHIVQSMNFCRGRCEGQCAFHPTTVSSADFHWGPLLCHTTVSLTSLPVYYQMKAWMYKNTLKYDTILDCEQERLQILTLLCFDPHSYKEGKVSLLVKC